MNKNSLARLGNTFPHKAVKSAVFKLTNECGLKLIEPTRLTACVGFTKNSLVQYQKRLLWLRSRQKTVNDWLKFANRSAVQIAVCSSLTATHQHYATVLKSLIRQCDITTSSPSQHQTLFNLEPIRQGEKRYVKNYH